LTTLSTSVKILELLAKSDSIIYGNQSTSASDLLFEYTRTSIVNRYQLLLAIRNNGAGNLEHKHSKTDKEHFQVTANQLIASCALVLEDNKDLDALAVVYKDHFNLVNMVKTGYFNLLSENATTFFQHYCFTFQVKEVLQVCDKIKEVNTSLSQCIVQFEAIPYNLFAPFVYSWIGECQLKLTNRLNESCAKEKWIDEKKRSLVADDLLLQCIEPVVLLKDHQYFDPGILDEDKKKDTFLHRFGKVVSKVIYHYGELVYNSFIDALPSEDKGQILSNFGLREIKPIKTNLLIKRESKDIKRIERIKKLEPLPQEQIIRYNTLVYLNDNIGELMKLFPDNTEIFSETTKLLARALDLTQKLITYWIQTNIDSDMKKFILQSKYKAKDKGRPKQLDIIFEFLENQIEILLYFAQADRFVLILKLIWQQITEDLHSCILGLVLENGAKSAVQSVRLTIIILEELKVLFFANGKGLTQETLSLHLLKLTEQLNSLVKEKDSNGLEKSRKSSS